MTNIGTVASIITWHCHNICTIHDKDTKLTSVFLKMSPVHHGIYKHPYIGAQTRAAYDTVMGAWVVVFGWCKEQWVNRSLARMIADFYKQVPRS